VCAWLIERGYSLVADDVTRITMLEGRSSWPRRRSLPQSYGSAWDRHYRCGKGLRDWQYSSRKALGPRCTLKDWQEVDEVDRIGLDREFYEILALKVPHVTIPVRPGRDMARLIEVAAMDEKLKGLARMQPLISTRSCSE